jgi:hypothetical protein
LFTFWTAVFFKEIWYTVWISNTILVRKAFKWIWNRVYVQKNSKHSKFGQCFTFRGSHIVMSRTDPQNGHDFHFKLSHTTLVPDSCWQLIRDILLTFSRKSLLRASHLPNWKRKPKNVTEPIKLTFCPLLKSKKKHIKVEIGLDILQDISTNRIKIIRGHSNISVRLFLFF